LVNLLLTDERFSSGGRKGGLTLAKILVVDDERAIVDSLFEIIESAGYEVQKAYSGQEAIAVAGESCPNVLLTDVLMPAMNGFEVALEVKKVCPGCRLLLFSGQAATAQLAQTFGPTFTRKGYRFELLPKPFHPTALLKKLEETLTYVV
jgi:CheY-like chemotaxis protein